MTIRVAIVDDQAMVRAGFRMIVESQSDMAVAGEAADGQEAMDLVGRVRPDEVLPNGVKYLLVSHNSAMGAGRGAVLLAEYLHHVGLAG